MIYGKAIQFLYRFVFGKKLCEHLFERGYYLCSFCPNELVFFTSYDSLCVQAAKLCIFYIHNVEWGDLASKKDEQVLRQKSPIIIYRRPYIDDIKKTISKGRFFVDTTYKNDITNFDLAYREYNHLVRWLKKHIEYKDYHFKDGRKCLYPISREVIELVQKGYILQI